MKSETVRAKLQKALERLEDVIDNRINALEIENTDLKSEIEKLRSKYESRQREIALNERKKPSIKDEKPSLLNSQVISEVDLTISKLKKIIG
jgi:uncharacterized sporulation protein YeaH/YhbH (DUF444 family)